MPEYQHPGVYIEEIERGPRPIEGVPTSTAALLGETERGSTNPRLVTSYSDYRHWFGDVFHSSKFLPHAVNGFFVNGGQRAFIARVVGTGARTAEAVFGDFVVRAAGPGVWGNRVKVKISDSTTKKDKDVAIGFRLQLAYWANDPLPDFDPFTDRTTLPQPTLTEDFDDLVNNESSPNYYGQRMENCALGMLFPAVGVPAHSRPSNGLQVLNGGADDSAVLGVDDYKGDPSPGGRSAQGLASLELEPYRDVSLVYAPNVSADIAKAIVAHCEKLRFRFVVIDSDNGQSITSALNPRDEIGDTSYAGFYYPWIVTADPQTGVRTLIPPGGVVLGIYARSDLQRGIFKAPANEIVRGALALEFEIDQRMQNELNPKSVNVIRSFPGSGIRVWGARTLSSDALWKYVNVRRLFIFLERSIYEGTQWVVFEPNDDRLWARVIDTIRLFLRTQWRAGALVGRTEQEAFFIQCDRTTMTQDDILNGRLICEVGVAPARPAEFVIFRIFQNTAEAQR